MLSRQILKNTVSFPLKRSKSIQQQGELSLSLSFTYAFFLNPVRQREDDSSAVRPMEGTLSKSAFYLDAKEWKRHEIMKLTAIQAKEEDGKSRNSFVTAAPDPLSQYLFQTVSFCAKQATPLHPLLSNYSWVECFVLFIWILQDTLSRFNGSWEKL